VVEAFEGVFEARTLAADQVNPLAHRVDRRLAMEQVAIIGAVGAAAKLEELDPGYRRLGINLGQPILDVYQATLKLTPWQLN
jgi:hypothetical protein